jgi:uncharacterized protein YndB with AHSA1/START domain
MDQTEIERTIEIDASPDTVFEVITSPIHLKEWWPEDAVIDATRGAVGHLVFRDPTSGEAHLPEVTVVDAQPPRLFSFRWVYPTGERAAADNSLLVTFEISPLDGGRSLLRMTETGYDQKAWTAADELEQEYRDHVSGWDHFLPQLVTYAPTVGATT